MRRGIAAAAGLGLLLGACCGENPPGVRVFAASSLTDVMQTLAADFERETGTRVRLNLASSSTLARQIVEGAPCDLFLSADEEWADYVIGILGPRSRMPLLENRLMFVEFARLPLRAGMQPPPWPEDDRYRRIAVGDPDHVPAGRYARRALEPGGTWEKIESRLVTTESVRHALALVESGEADGGIVYETDARSAGDRVREMAILPGVVATYPLLLVDESGGGPHLRFVRYLCGERGRRAFERAGFRFLEGGTLRK